MLLKPNDATENARPVPTDEGFLTRERALVVVLAVATALAFYLCWLVALPFVPALAWALALAVVARPMHDWLAAKIPYPDLAAGIAVALVGILILGPAIFVVHQMTLEAARGIEFAKAGMEDGKLQAAAEEAPAWLSPGLQWVQKNLEPGGEIPRVIQSHAGSVTEVLTGSIWAIAQLLLVLFSLYFFFRDRRLFLQGVRALVPLSERETDHVFKRVSDTIHATVYGTLLVAFLQGALGGLMFWWLDLPAPLTWGVVMALLAIVPYLGAFVVWGPAALFLALSGEYGKAIALVAWGTIVVGFIDNLVYPIFVGQRLKLHTLLAFLAVVGGLGVFGASGLILGPALLAITIAFVDVWRRRTAGGHSAEEGVNSSQGTLVIEDGAFAQKP